MPDEAPMRFFVEETSFKLPDDFEDDDIEERFVHAREDPRRIGPPRERVKDGCAPLSWKPKGAGESRAAPFGSWVDGSGALLGRPRWRGLRRRPRSLPVGRAADVEGDHVLGEAIHERYEAGRPWKHVRPVLEG